MHMCKEISFKGVNFTSRVVMNVGNMTMSREATTSFYLVFG